MMDYSQGSKNRIFFKCFRNDTSKDLKPAIKAVTSEPDTFIKNKELE